MPQEIVINTLGDIEPAFKRVLESDNDQFTLEVNPELEFSIVLKGDTWDGLVDVRVAKFVTELQHAYDRVRREIGVPDADKRLVKVRIKDGSTEIQTRIIDIVAETLRGMTNQQQFVILLSFMGLVFAGWSIRKVLQFLNEREAARLNQANAQQNAELVKNLNQTVQFAIEKIDAEKPLRLLVNSMKETDTVRFNAQEQELTKQQARDRFPRRQRVTPVDAMLDDNYRVEQMVLEQPASLVLSKGDIDLKASFGHGLKVEDTEALLSEVKQALEQQKPMRVALHIDGRVNDQAVIHAVIVGIGKAPRDGSVDVGDFLG